ncbi:MAG TPA: YfhO family protein [Candidatus Paceibacterota bacterium]
METKTQKFINFLKRHYPSLTIVGVLIVIYIPYLSGKYILVGPGIATRTEVWDFILGSNFGWIDFYKNMGEFVGGAYHYGYFNPIHILFRTIEIKSSLAAEYLLTLIYASATFFGTYYLFRKNTYAKWIALLSAAIFTLNGQAFTTDVNTSESFANLLYMPLLFILAEQNFAGLWRKLGFGVLIFLEASNSTPQFIVWQIIIIGLYLLYVRPAGLSTSSHHKSTSNFYTRSARKKFRSLNGRSYVWALFKSYSWMLVIGAIALLPQVSLTQIIYSGYDTQSIIANPHLLAWPGNPLSYALQLIDPFAFFAQYGYLTPYYYTALIGTLIFFFFIPTLIRKWRETPKNIKFFFITALFFLIASFQGSPLQEYFLEKIPFVDFILTRNPYRYVYFYFFSMSFVVAYCLQNYLASKEQLKKFAKALFIVGGIGVIGYILSSVVYFIWGNDIFEILKERFVKNRLPNVRGGYDPLYYINLLKMYFDLYIPKNTLFTWSGILSALPFLSFLVFGYAVVKEKIKEPLKYFPHFIVLQVILTGFIFSAVLAQDARPNTKTVFDKKENNLSLTIKEKPDWRNSYIMSYGNYAGEIYLKNLYRDSAEIYEWLSINQYTNHINYDSIPRIQNEVLPVRLFKDQLLGTYVGYQLVDLFRLEGQFPDNQKSNPRLLNELAYDKDLINPEKMEKNLSERIGILRNIGVRYIVSQYKFDVRPSVERGSTEASRPNVPGIKMVQELSFGKKSDLLPEYTATLYLYEINNPGKIVFVPEKVRLIAFNSLDILDFAKVKIAYDNLNFKNISLIEWPDLPKDNLSDISQNTTQKNIILDKASNDRITFKTAFSADSYVIINNYHYDGWRAFIDQKETPIGRANLMFMAIKVPKGEHSIELQFEVNGMLNQSR